MTFDIREWRSPQKGSRDVQSGTTYYQISEVLLERYRNISIEVLLTDVSPGDSGLKIEFKVANDIDAFEAKNIGTVGDSINVDPLLAINDKLAFVRNFSGIDHKYLRAYVTGPSGATAKMSMTVRGGGRGL